MSITWSISPNHFNWIEESDTFVSANDRPCKLEVEQSEFVKALELHLSNLSIVSAESALGFTCDFYDSSQKWMGWINVSKDGYLSAHNPSPRFLCKIALWYRKYVPEECPLYFSNDMEDRYLEIDPNTTMEEMIEFMGYDG
ncbi:MAG: hypothetical protein BroJett018_40910 [Chloroflexota bacterium]|nr:hypothetical protein [Chloroflexota bacterium]NOG64704.1 hypothetical protein [Chloroflexota bacterium]GIK66297.1 MAG: hypothetical protein BroJett018_40910 [Chloroflexota bacterium]